jgi:hypothetical protein
MLMSMPEIFSIPDPLEAQSVDNMHAAIHYMSGYTLA